MLKRNICLIKTNKIDINKDNKDLEGIFTNFRVTRTRRLHKVSA